MIKEIFEEGNIELTAIKEAQFCRYTELLIEYNQKFNLTAITEPSEIAVKHFLDSVQGARFLKQGTCVIDIGSGAGFPAIPLKILRPDLDFTMLDSLNKRVNFLNTVIEELKLTGAAAVHLRAEDAGRGGYRERYDACVARAVAPLRILTEYALPLVKKGGVFLSYKGGEPENEIGEAENAIKKLGGKLTAVEKFTLPGELARSIIIIEKVKITPENYPRGQNKPRISPL